MWLFSGNEVAYYLFLSYAESHKLFDKNGDEDETIQQSEFVMQQLLHLCACLDHSDEIGRFVGFKSSLIALLPIP